MANPIASQLTATATVSAEIRGRAVATAGSPYANTYCSEPRSVAILDGGRLNVSQWTALSMAQREAALIWATYLLDLHFDWNGYKATEEQALRFPQTGIEDLDGYEIDDETIPADLERATAELAFELAKKDRLRESSLLGLGLSKAKVGPIDVSVDPKAGAVPDLIPRYIVTNLRVLGCLASAASSGARTIPLRRN